MFTRPQDETNGERFWDPVKTASLISPGSTARLQAGTRGSAGCHTAGQGAECWGGGGHGNS